LKVDREVFHAAASWVELADYIPALLAGVTSPRDVVRGVCPAGHKAMYSESWGGLPSAEFLARLDPELASLRDRLYERAYAADRPAGALSPEWAERLGLTAGIPIAMGSFDAHYGAVGAGVRTGTFVKIIGTSTCDIAVASAAASVPDIPGICGIVNGSVMPGYYGIEAGQSAVGDILQWWVDVVCGGSDGLHAELSAQSARLLPGASGLVALDWNNGNRTILVDPRLTGLIVGQTLHTTRAEIYRALIEATAFGARAIIERVAEYGVPIERVVCCGGIAEKNDLFMQIYADVIGRPMLIAGSRQTPALGAAIAAAVTAGEAAGGYACFELAQERMTTLADRRFMPELRAHAVYDELYGVYRELHDVFGGVPGARADLAQVMKRLLAIRERCSGQGDGGSNA
jgi:L-ribulokinase